MFELKTKHVLEKAGYYVISSRGSHGILDLVAINETYVLGLQLKKNCNVSKIEMDAMHNMFKPNNMFLICLIKTKERTEVRFVGAEPDRVTRRKIINDLTGRLEVYV